MKRRQPMFVAAWQFDMQFGAREETLRMLKESKESFAKISGWKAKRTRILHGSIGAPESRIVIEHDFASLADLESSWAALRANGELFHKMVSQMKTVIVHGTPRWEVYRVVDEG